MEMLCQVVTSPGGRSCSKSLLHQTSNRLYLLAPCQFFFFYTEFTLIMKAVQCNTFAICNTFNFHTEFANSSLKCFTKKMQIGNLNA